MFFEPRLYRDERDLDAMHAVLQAGRLAANGTYYVHIGDVNWWLFYPYGTNLLEHLYLWDDPSTPGRLLAWALLSYDDYNTFDLVIQPELRGSRLAQAMLDWAEQRLMGILRTMGKDVIRAMWILEDDAVVGGLLKQRGYQVVDASVYMVCPLEQPIQTLALQDGWRVRSCRGQEEVEARATAQYGAFESSRPFDVYVARFRTFMRSRVYQSEWDMVAANGDGTISSFCIAWPDPLTRVGNFEPVGTHPAYQRRGFGKAVMLETLQRLQQAGMRQAIVTTAGTHTPAIKLYESVGFHIANHLLTYEKKFA